MSRHTPSNQATPERPALTPLPTRMTPRQIERLHAARARDGLSIQEHVRRAVDVYLDGIEPKAYEVTLPPLVPDGSPAMAGQALEGFPQPVAPKHIIEARRPGGPKVRY